MLQVRDDAGGDQTNAPAGIPLRDRLRVHSLSSKLPPRPFVLHRNRGAQVGCEVQPCLRSGDPATTRTLQNWHVQPYGDTYHFPVAAEYAPQSGQSGAGDEGDR